MLSARTFARQAPRIASRIAARPRLATLRTPQILRQAWKPSLPAQRVAAFHVSASRRQVNEELVAKLESEISMEADVGESDNYSGNIKDYLEQSPFELIDTPGSEEVVLTRKYNDENIRVTFSIADLANAEDETDPMVDESMYDEDEPPSPEQSGGATTKGSVNTGRTRGGNLKVASEDQVSPADRPEFEEDEDYADEERQPSFPARANITIERPGRGALAIEASCQSGELLIEAVHYFPSLDDAEPKTAEKDYARRAMYTGPPFGNLDEDLQLLLEQYLKERGLGTHFALFVPDYIDYKEQKEYVKWLGNLKNFVQ